ncbi:MAG: 16S rRNA (guanine(527)-N(7))-methyltransferase RsmG [Gammaproteobacteria bacterium]|nr:16S rRNA (guanine(527)-N(7))-methyltransferase RsmG [Gammaproteobacteria bacterium]|tara:strand:- start:1010 stop:1735 length:726 start_codon:yes stop_codon:yes gene_type:complete
MRSGAAARRTRPSVGDRPAEANRAEALIAGAAALEVALTGAQADRLLGFAELLEQANRAFNLISRQDVPRLLARHLLDSLSAAPLLPAGTALDLGTGGGLPGVPLAIAREDIRFTLVDRSERKTRFVARAVRTLGLANVTVRCGDVAGLALAPCDAVVSRAVTAPDRLWALAEPKLAEGGIVVAMYRADGQGEAGSPTPPAGAEVRTRRRVDIPGLPRPHEILVLARAASAPTDETDARRN